MTGQPRAEALYQAAIAADGAGESARARAHLREAVEAGSGEARLALAGALIDGRGGPVEPEEAAAAALPLEAAHPIARRMLTIALALGPGGWPAALERRIDHAFSGDREAMFEIGLLLLDAGSPEAAVWLRQAADDGSGHAIAALAHIALDAGARWEGLDTMLGRLAATGYPLAGALQARVAPLPRTAPIPGGAPDRKGALKALVKAAGAAPGKTRLLSEAPHVAACDRLIHPALCDYLVSAALPMLERARMFDASVGESREHPHRRAFAAAFPHSLMDAPMLAVQTRMAALSGSDPARAEALAILVYRAGDEYRPHLDCFTDDGGQASAEIAARGQRVATTLVSLNSEYEGGETAFPRADLRWRGRPGDALAFRNVLESGAPDPLTLHAGEPVASGWKALASLWLRERPVGPEGALDRR